MLDNDQTHPLQQTRMRQMRRASRGSWPVILLALEVVLVVAFVVGLVVVVVVVVELEVVVVVVASFEPFKSDFHVSFQRWKKTCRQCVCAIFSPWLC